MTQKFVTKLPPMNLLARLSKTTVCAACGNEFTQRKSSKKRNCPTCRGARK